MRATAQCSNPLIDNLFSEYLQNPPLIRLSASNIVFAPLFPAPLLSHLIKLIDSMGNHLLCMLYISSSVAEGPRCRLGLNWRCASMKNKLMEIFNLFRLRTSSVSSAILMSLGPAAEEHRTDRLMRLPFKRIN